MHKQVIPTLGLIFVFNGSFLDQDSLNTSLPQIIVLRMRKIHRLDRYPKAGGSETHGSTSPLVCWLDRHV
jgi:hypothetical protein